MKKIFDKIFLPFLAAVMILIIYGGLNLANLQNQNQKLNQKQIALEAKLADLEKSVNDNKIALAQNEQQIADYAQQVAYYKKLATVPKMILGEQTESAPAVTTASVPAKIVTKTVYVKKEVPKKQVVVVIDGVGSYQIDWQSNDTAWTVLKRAAEKNNFGLQYQMYDFGVFITGIGGITPTGNQYWAFYYNGKYAQVGASGQTVSPNDTTFWQLATF